MQAGRRHVRQLVVAVVLVVAPFAAVGCAGPTGHSSHPVLTAEHWVRGGSARVTVSHPVSWRLSRFKYNASFAVGLFYLSNDKFAAPCATTGNVTACDGFSHATLRSAGVLIRWMREATLDGSAPLRHAGGRRTRIAGHAAKLAIEPASGRCKADGGSLWIEGTVSVPPAANALVMSACLSHPSNSLRAQVLQSLRSLRT